MPRFVPAVALTGLAAVAFAGMLQAKPALRDVDYVREGLIAAGIAYEIGDKCDGISARMLRGVLFLQSLQNHARDLGYTEEEIDAYVNDRAEADRLKAVAYQRLWSMGAVEGQYDTYCAVGRAEIAAGSQIGRLLND
ncbi:hypothetical protein EU803_11605 [Loktanella sp. IMCC34160]|uniref:DUF5333 domain-containing protein n=1 Tax=Rhodobacterales TaxID=204455 RepID=UPI00101D5A2C|nr:DUF5333 domain-containing protein [Loktanella sp. IMCC34160]RYG90641.1 hypothetical protein EU803_11605 [Loktanella sp. IMCC34160]